MSVFDAAVSAVLDEEGGYSDDSGDRGGATNWGVSEAVARAFGYVGAMRAMTRAEAVEIYRLRYWQQPMLDKLEAVDADLARLCFDLGVNLGTAWPGRFLQRALNAVHEAAQVPVDGVSGALTRAALVTFLHERGVEGRRVLVFMVRAQASVRYLELAEAGPAAKRFEYGWQRSRALGAQENS